MAHSGEKIVNPITGERIVFRDSTGETDGARLVMDVELRPGGVIAGAPHRHPFEERFHVTRGRLAGWIAGQGPLSKHAGERFVVPAGVDHLVLNGAPGFSRAEVEAVPGQDFDRLLEVAFALSAGKAPPGTDGRMDGVRALARLLLEQGVRLAFVPGFLQERLLAAAIGRSRAPAGSPSSRAS